MPIKVEHEGPVTIVTINRPEVRNCVNRETAQELPEAWRAFDADNTPNVGAFCGEKTGFCAGADLKAVASGEGGRAAPDGDGPMGPSRMLLGKPVIAAITGHPVAGGLGLAPWCDLRSAAEDAGLGRFFRRTRRIDTGCMGYGT